MQDNQRKKSFKLEYQRPCPDLVCYLHIHIHTFAETSEATQIMVNNNTIQNKNANKTYGKKPTA